MPGVQRVRELPISNLAGGAAFLETLRQYGPLDLNCRAYVLSDDRIELVMERRDRDPIIVRDANMVGLYMSALEKLGIDHLMMKWGSDDG